MCNFLGQPGKDLPNSGVDAPPNSQTQILATCLYISLPEKPVDMCKIEFFTNQTIFLNNLDNINL